MDIYADKILIHIKIIKYLKQQIINERTDILKKRKLCEPHIKIERWNIESFISSLIKNKIYGVGSIAE